MFYICNMSSVCVCQWMLTQWFLCRDVPCGTKRFYSILTSSYRRTQSQSPPAHSSYGLYDVLVGGVTVVTPTEWQEDWVARWCLVWMPRKNAQNASKIGKSYAIWLYKQIQQKNRAIFYRLLIAAEKKSKWITAMHKNNWTTPCVLQRGMIMVR